MRFFEITMRGWLVANLPLPDGAVKKSGRFRIPGTFYRSLTVTAPYVVDSANGAVTVRER